MKEIFNQTMPSQNKKWANIDKSTKDMKDNKSITSNNF